MIFREIRTQLFWNWVFYFIHYNLPYDWILPYLEEENLWNGVYTHCEVNIEDLNNSSDSEIDLFKEW